MAFYASLLIAMLFTLVLIPPLIRWAGVLGAVDIPNDRKVHQKVVPRIGGVAIVLGAMFSLLIWLPYEPRYLAIATAVLILVLFGFWDDRRDISYKYKFLGQVLAGICVVCWGNIRVLNVPVIGELPLLVSWVFTLVCLLAVTNALNLADGLDGLAGGTTLLSFGLIGILAYNAGADYILFVAMAVVGGVLGFLRFNSHPAAIFMGDTGSQFLGFILGIELILLTQFADPALSWSIPLLLLGLPLLDTIMVMVKRIISGRSPFSPDKNHMHHRLLALGFSHSETVVILYFIQSAFVISAFATAYARDWLPGLLFMVYLLMIGLVFHCLELKNYRFEKHNQWIASWSWESVAFKDWLRGLNFERYLHVYIIFVLLLLILFTGAASISISMDVRLLAALLALTLAFSMTRALHTPWLDRLGVYTFCALLCYLGYQAQNSDNLIYAVEWVLVLVASVWVFFTISMQKASRRFETSPLDVLLVLLALLVPVFARSSSDIDHLPLEIIKFVVLLYLFEYLISSGIYYRFRCIGLVLVCGSLMIVVKGTMY